MPVQLSVKDFGPIREGTIELAPLTVCVGPNNSGKSVVAMLMYAATRSPRIPWSPAMRYGLRGRVPYRPMGDTPAYSRDHADFVEALIRNPRLPTSRFPRSFLDLLKPHVDGLLQSYAFSVRSEMARSFGARLQELSRSSGGKRGRRFTVTIEHGDPSWRVMITSVRNRTTIDSSELDLPSLVRRTRRELPDLFEARWLPNAAPDYFLMEFGELVSLVLFRELPLTSYYLPAARSGFLQSHRAIASSVVSRAPYAGIEDMQIPKMSGVIADFISALLEMPGEQNNADINRVADFLENTLEGSIRLETKPGSYPDIWYEGEAGRLPLHRTSSMVSELAPVVLYMRFLLDPGELLIIEEPESHLHPASQLVLARALARLVNSGVRVLLTTHSDYFLSQLNNLIRAASLEPAAYRRERISQRETIAPDRIRAYTFDRSGSAGTRVERVRVSKVGGIPADEFARVAEPLYSETVHLQRRLIDAD